VARGQSKGAMVVLPGRREGGVKKLPATPIKAGAQRNRGKPRN
jgi:hypothetical protein